ncbi:MAG: GxxExxY protein [Patescibacteria group bacterium]
MLMMRTSKVKLIYEDLTYEINGILFSVSKELGVYRNEKQYCDAIEKLLKEREIPYEREKRLPASFDGEALGRNRIDFLISNKIVLEIKAKPFITREDYYQTMRYLKALNKKLGILVNMRRRAINPKRVLNKEAEK